MKKLLIALLLFSGILQAQEFDFSCGDCFTGNEFVLADTHTTATSWNKSGGVIRAGVFLRKKNISSNDFDWLGYRIVRFHISEGSENLNGVYNVFYYLFDKETEQYLGLYTEFTLPSLCPSCYEYIPEYTVWLFVDDYDTIEEYASAVECRIIDVHNFISTI